MFNIKALALATAVSAGVVLAMPATSEAMKVKVQTGSQSNLEQKKSKTWWARHCAISNDVKCGRHYTRRHYDKYYGKYRPDHKKSGVTITVD